MTCSQNPLYPVTIEAPTPSSAINSFTPIPGQRFFVSDNPEPLTPQTFTTPIITLWNDTVPNLTSVRYRVFMWHHNATANTIKYGLTLGNAGSSPLTVSEFKFETAETIQDILSNAGYCLSKALLGQTLNSTANVTVSPGAVQVLKEFTIAPKAVRGTVLEFTVSSSTPMSAKLRSVAAQSISAALNTHQGAAVPQGAKDHPRGTWNYADVQGADATVTIGSGGISNSFTILNSANPVFSGTLPNTASFAGIYKFNLTIVNASGSSQTKHLYFNPRGGLFVGAVKVGSNPVNGITKTSDTQSVRIGAFTIPNGQSITVPIQITTGGGSSTPLAFFAKNA
ncbi:hypothetical protein J7E73_28865 [Paenibacillus albidus]|uniref:hypothetical protein n=1 Tax=Paenibacillus albidus TaxID=2041023 RepID=UPI001BE68B4E|nr:hypothetical protein [Paenibacillus albidus]MBT2293054.1 hypothetical protein [Paenibacillus albidus]